MPKWLQTVEMALERAMFASRCELSKGFVISDDRGDETGTAEWGLRSYQDKPDSSSWGGQNVFDVVTKSDGIALDGTKYKDW